MSEKQNFKSLSSGLKELIAEEESDKRFIFLFDLLINEKYSKLKDFFLEHADLIDSIKLKALKLYTKLVLKEEIKTQDISLTEIRPFIADAIAKELASIHRSQSKYLNLNFESLYKLLPKLEAQLNIEHKSSPKESYTLKLLDTTNTFSSENFKEKLSTIYQEISEIQKNVSKLNNIDKETCFKANCCDCCVYTPPLVTKLEFEYIKANIDLTKAKINAQKNQLLHKAEYGSELEIIDLDQVEKENMNPHNFPHRCPFLAEDNGCSIHEHRPFACRFYGLATLDGKSVQACNFYLEQFDPKERTVLDSRQATKILGKANRELCDGKQLAGTLTAWLTE